MFDFSLPAQAWQDLVAHAKDEVYAPAQVSFEGDPLGTVGIRFKGSIGTLSSCFDAQGKLTCPKLSMKLGFDEYVADTRFFGLKRLNLHSMVWDESKLHERLAYDLYRTTGVVAPRSTWAVVRVNGESFGLYSMVEQIDGRFTRDRFPTQGNGNLYKEAWPLASDADYYARHLETDAVTPGAAAHSAFLDFHAALSAASSAAEARSALGERMDLGYLANYMAVDDAIANVDGVTAAYIGADPHQYQNHNFYVYLEEQRDFFWLIPWDMDATFGPRGDFEAIPHWNSASPDCARAYTVWGGASVVSAACDPLFRALAADQNAYQSAVDTLLAGDFSEETLVSNIDRHAAFIAAAVAADPKGPGLPAWQANVAALKAKVPLLRERLLHLRDRVPSTPLILSTLRKNDFEGLDAFAVALAGAPAASANSEVGVSLEAQSALSGTKDLRLDFTYRNAGDPPANPWGQWIYFLLAIENAPPKLVSGMRLRLRADQARSLRIDLQSPLYEAPSEGIKFGWDVAVGPQASLVEVRFADAALPSWARPTSDSLSAVLSNVVGIAFQPNCQGRDTNGFLPLGGSDPGFLQVDDLEFF